MNKLAKILPYSAVALPIFALAQPGLPGTGGGSGGSVQTDLGFFTSLVSQISTLLDTLIPLVIAIGLLFFIWGLVQYIAASGDEAAKDEGKRKMIWGIIALFVIVSVWGLVALLNQLTGIGQGDTVDTVTIPK